MITAGDVLPALLLLMVANSAAWLSGRIPGLRLAALPLDFGVVLRDGKRLFGSHKTWRGLITGVLAASLVAPLVGVHPMAGAGVGAMSLAGDVLSSGIKRRLRFPPGADAPGLDQLPEALIPIIVFRSSLRLSVVEIVLVAVVFLAADLAATRAARARR